jgi:iron-sulfur cluster assembly protein
MHIDADGIEIVVSEHSQGLLDGMTVDYVEIEPDTFQFIFLNPNDANYSPPA